MIMVICIINFMCIHLCATAAGSGSHAEDVYRGFPEDTSGPWPERAQGGASHFQLCCSQQAQSHPWHAGVGAATPL